jgi:HK97 family phage portal protein
MNLFQRIASAFSAKAGSSSQVVFQGMGNPVVTPADMKKLAAEAYAKNVIAFAAINYVATNAAAVPWHLKQGKRDLPSHPLLDLLERPNPLQGRVSFLESLVGFLKIAGNSYVHAVGPTSDAVPMELWPMRPDRMKIIAGEHSLPAAYEYKLGNEKQIFPVDQVGGKSPILHIKTWNPLNDWYGMSPIEPGAISVDTSNAASKFNLALLQNQGRPSGFFVIEPSDKNPSGMLKPEQHARMKEELNRTYSGVSNAGRMGFLEGGLKWQSMSLSPQDMEWIQGKGVSAREIALGLGVPPMLLNIPGDNTYANYQEARLAFYIETVLPLLEKLKFDLNNWLTPKFGEGLSLEYDRDQIEALEPMRQRKWDKAEKADFLSINEKRESVGYAPIDGGDTVFIPAGMVPLEFANSDPSTSQDPSADPAAADSSAKDFSDVVPEAKLLNLPNRGARVKEWRDTVRIRASFERRLANQFKSAFKTQKASVLKALGSGTHDASDRIEAALKDDAARMTTLLTSHLTAIGKTFGARVFKSVKFIPAPTETKSPEGSFDSFLASWVKRSAFHSIEGINKTTLKKLKEELQLGLDAGETIDEIADRLSQTYDDFSESRSITIARTETLSASNAASEGAARATGIPDLKKEWISAEDERTRRGHAEVDGTVVPIDSDFQVKDEDGTVHMLSRPGDPKGGASQVINCRCTLAFVKEGEE